VPFTTTILQECSGCPTYLRVFARLSAENCFPSKVETQLVADKLLARLGPPLVDSVQDGPYAAELAAPFLLGVVPSRIKHPTEYWPAVAQLRVSFAPLRRRIAEEKDKWNGRSAGSISTYLRNVNGYLPDSLEVAGETLTATATAVASVATPPRLVGDWRS